MSNNLRKLHRKWNDLRKLSRKSSDLCKLDGKLNDLRKLNKIFDIRSNYKSLKCDVEQTGRLNVFRTCVLVKK